MYHKKISTLLVSCLLAGLALAQNQHPFSFEASYVGDVLGNMSGGLDRKAGYLGMANIAVGFDTEKANWWKGGEAFVKFSNTHGSEPTADFVGDFQTVSNIEAGNASTLYELWFKQSFGKFSFVAGLQDLNVNFAASENAGLFINSSFGIHPTIASNTAVPIFPITAWGLDLHWNIGEDYLWHTAIFDGTPDEISPYNTEWSLGKKDGLLAITEFELGKSLIAGRSGSYKLGAYYHQHEDEESETMRNGGVYLVADQDISDQLSLFAQVGISPKEENVNKQYYALGLNWKNIWESRPKDMLGFAVAHASLSHSAVASETVLELIYNFQLNENIYLRPDIQYVINPAGTGEKINNALVGILRFGVEF